MRHDRVRARTPNRVHAGLVVAAAWLATCGVAHADVSNLDSGLPVEIEDARPTESGSREVQLPLRWDRERGGASRLLFEPRLQWGFAGRWEALVGVRAIGGSTDRTGSGDLRLEVLRQFADERGALPALAGLVRIDLPSGKDSHGIDSAVGLVATRTLGSRPNAHQVHVNAIWIKNAAPLVQERPERARLLVGYSTPLDGHTAVMVDWIREQSQQRSQMATIAEIGVRHELAHQTMVSVGVGAGHGGDSGPRWRIVLGLQQGF